MTERALEHVKDALFARSKSHIALHLAEDHPELLQEAWSVEKVLNWFQFRVKEQHMTALRRQLREALALQEDRKNPSIKVLNLKLEYTRCIIP